MYCRFCRDNQLILLFPQTKHFHTKVSRALGNKIFNCTSSEFGEHGPIVKCNRCHIIYDDHFLSQKYLNYLYRQTKDTLYLNEQKARKVTFLRYLRQINKYKKDKGRLLDIGTNTGLFIHLAQKKGWRVFGIDPNDKAALYGKEKYGLQIITKSFIDYPFPGNHFDCITMFDVIEHFENPIEVLAKIYKLLKPGGLLMLSTVDPQSLLSKAFGSKWPWYMPMHRVFFSKKAIRFYLEKYGFKKVIFAPHYRYLSMQYLASRTAALHPMISRVLTLIIRRLHLSNVIIPFRAFDLYNCYAIK